MNIFGKLPQEQAMQTLIHDTNKAIFETEFHLNKLTECIKECQRIIREKDPDHNFSSKPYVHIEYLKSRRKDMIKAIDDYTVKFKNDFNS